MAPLFTVFTPTYNRSKTIIRVYESLRKQTLADFEWLIVDDGSNDGTSTLVQQWQKEAQFPIRYVWQKNGHKKKAFNHGVKIAAGELFLCADSDDTFPPNALEKFAHYWHAIPKNEQQLFVGVCGLCQDENGKVVGDIFPGDWGVDSDAIQIRHRFGVRGEKWGFSRTDVLRANLFPEYLPGHVPESVVWAEIASLYKTRFVNEIVRVYHQDANNQVTKNSNPSSNSAGMLYSKRCVLEYEIGYFWYSPIYFLLEGARWSRFRLHLDVDQSQLTRYWPSSTLGKLIIVSMGPIGIAWWFYDLFKKI